MPRSAGWCLSNRLGGGAGAREDYGWGWRLWSARRSRHPFVRERVVFLLIAAILGGGVKLLKPCEEWFYCYTDLAVYLLDWLAGVNYGITLSAGTGKECTTHPSEKGYILEFV